MNEVKGNVVEPESERELILTRVFDVPARILFLACSRPEHMRQWFGPKEYPLTLCEMDFRVGGKYRFAMTGPNGVQNTPFGGEYLAIEEDRKITFTNAFEEPGSETMVMTYTFEEAGGKTTLHMRTVFASIAMKKLYLSMGFEAGTNSALDQLVALVERLVSA